MAAGVDTNVFNQPGTPVPDTGFVLSPGATARYAPGRRLQLEGTGGLNVNYFRREGSERFVDRFGEARAELAMRRFTLYGRIGGGQYRERFSIEIDERVLRQEAHAAAGVRGRLSRRLGASAEWLGESYRFGPSVRGEGGGIRDALDRNTYATRVGLEWSLTRRTRAVALFDVVEDRFRVPRASGRRELPSTRVLAGFESGPKTAVRGRLLGGVRRYPALGAGTAGGATVPVVSAAFSLPVGELVRLGASAERDVYYSVATANPGARAADNAYVYGIYRVEAVTQLPFGLLARGYVGVDRSTYLLPVPTSAGLAPALRRSIAGGSLLRKMGDSIQAGAFVDFARRQSPAPAFAYDGWRFGVEVRVTP
jgi:hypothetical protein